MRASFFPFGLLYLFSDGGKEAAKGVGGCDCPLQGLAFGERDNIRDGILHAKAIGGTLGAEQFHFRGPDLGD